MNRVVGFGVAAAVGALLAIGGVWLTPTNGGSADAPAGGARAGLDDLVRAMQLVPMSGERAHPFTLPSLDGASIALGNLKGRPVLLYFWASW